MVDCSGHSSKSYSSDVFSNRGPSLAHILEVTVSQRSHVICSTLFLSALGKRLPQVSQKRRPMNTMFSRICSSLFW